MPSGQSIHWLQYSGQRVRTNNKYLLKCGQWAFWSIHDKQTCNDLAEGLLWTCKSFFKPPTLLLWSLILMMGSFFLRSHTTAFPLGLAEARMCWTCRFQDTTLMSSAGWKKRWRPLLSETNLLSETTIHRWKLHKTCALLVMHPPVTLLRVSSDCLSCLDPRCISLNHSLLMRADYSEWGSNLERLKTSNIVPGKRI